MQGTEEVPTKGWELPSFAGELVQEGTEEEPIEVPFEEPFDS